MRCDSPSPTVSTTTTSPDFGATPAASSRPRPSVHARRHAASLSLPALLILLALTVAYLFVELGFNAQVLQSVGATLGLRELEGLQYRGNFISGLAMGLLALHVMFRLRSRSKRRTGESRPDLISVVLYGLLAISCMASLLLTNMERLVNDRPAEFRKQALSIHLMQNATISKVLTWNSQEDPELFSGDAGKAFLAFYPFMTAARDTLASEVQPLVKYHAKQSAVQQMGGIEGFYEDYKRAIDSITRDHNMYVHASRRPQHYKSPIPSGLNLQQYIAHPRIQEQLRSMMKLPEKMAVPYVTTEATFRSQMYEPLLAARVQSAVTMFGAPVSAFENDRTHGRAGAEAVKRVLLPPVLLTASMAGLVVHFALLVYLVLQLLTLPLQKATSASKLRGLSGSALVLTPVVVVAVVWAAMAFSSNAMTRSASYQDMGKYLSMDNPKNLPLTGVANQLLHTMTVGEAWVAPLGQRALPVLQSRMPKLFR